MERVSGKIFYHIQKIDKYNNFTPWEKDKTYTINGQDINPYYSFFTKTYPHCTYNEKEYPMNVLSKGMVKYLEKGSKLESLRDVYHFDKNRSIQELSQSLDHYLKIKNWKLKIL